MKQLIILIFLFNFMYAYEFKLNEKEISYINNSSKKTFILNRLKKYEKGSLTTSTMRGWSRGNIHAARVLDSYMVN